MKIYISPSTQEHNAYAGGGNEEQYMRALATNVCTLLVQAGHQVKMGGTVSATSNANDANAWGAEAYYALHTNAGGGHGTEVWHYTGSVKGKAMAEKLYARVAPATAFPDRGIKSNTTFAELRIPRAPAALVEMAFHDNLPEAAEIKEHVNTDWPWVIAQGILDYAGGAFPAPTPPPVTPPVHTCPPDPHPSDANEQIAAYEAREDKALALARELVTLFSN